MFAPSIDPAQRLALDQGFPEGWFAFALSAELSAEAVVPRRAFGRDFVLWRTEDGGAHCANAECPHYGVHMGHGGKVKDGGLMCPIHGLRFDPAGRCLPGRPGKPAPDVSIRTYPVAESSGVIHIWRSISEAPAGPIAKVDREGMTVARRWTVPLDWSSASAQARAVAMASSCAIYITPVESDQSDIIAVASISANWPTDEAEPFASIENAFGVANLVG